MLHLRDMAAGTVHNHLLGFQVLGGGGNRGYVPMDTVWVEGAAGTYRGDAGYEITRDNEPFNLEGRIWYSDTDTDCFYGMTQVVGGNPAGYWGLYRAAGGIFQARCNAGVQNFAAPCVANTQYWFGISTNGGALSVMIIEVGGGVIMESQTAIGAIAGVNLSMILLATGAGGAPRRVYMHPSLVLIPGT